MNIDEHAVTRYQRSANELVVYSRKVGRAVTISGRNVLRAHGLFLECFCGFLSDRLNPKSCQIILSSATGDVLGFCHYDSPRCGFFINFTEIYNKCFLTSVYGHLPTLGTIQLAAMFPTWMRFVSPLLYTSCWLKELPLILKAISESISPNFQLELVNKCSWIFTASTRRHSTPYARMQKEVPASHQRYLEIDDGYPRSRQVQTAPAVAGPSRILMKSASAAAPFRAVDDGGDDDRERKETKYLCRLIRGKECLRTCGMI
ncbi:hypothetical protein DFH09DRAFT_1110974 [Mycena vulgaris]|nr:hypothetical protein DFH09DRAFT_1110974 [Mycena vulgaris]